MSTSGTQRCGAGRDTLILTTLGGRLDFLKVENRTDKKHMPSPWTSLHCTMTVSHLALILDAELLHSEEDHICDFHNVSRRWLSHWISLTEKGKKRESPSTLPLWPCGICSEHRSQLGQHPSVPLRKGAGTTACPAELAPPC